MHWLTGPLLFLATVVAMEGVAYIAHRWVMHGPGWILHASHHRARTMGRPPVPRTGCELPGDVRTGPWFEANDLYAVIFAAPSILLIFGGVNLAWGAGAVWIGAGIAAYGAIYFGFHDVIVHKRIAHRYVARSSYMKRIVQAHRLHHAVETKEGTVSFGFLWAPPAEELKAELARRGNAGVRAPTRAEQPSVS